jgi:hypothetical protein
MPSLHELIHVGLWLPLPVVLVVGLYRLRKQNIIVAGDLSSFLVYLFTAAAFGVAFNPDFDEVIRYSAKLMFFSGALATVFYLRRRKPGR